MSSKHNIGLSTKELHFGIELYLEMEPVKDATGDIVMNDGDPVIDETPTFRIPSGVEERLSRSSIAEIYKVVENEFEMSVEDLYRKLDREAKLGSVRVRDNDIEFEPRGWIMREL